MYYVYIAYFNNKLSIGVTVDLKRRIKLLKFQNNQNLKIVYYEEYEDSKIACKRENQLQSFSKELLYELIIENNPMLINLI